MVTKAFICLLAFDYAGSSAALKDTASASLRAQGSQTFPLRSQARARKLCARTLRFAALMPA
jgi:hypothetical protein